MSVNTGSNNDLTMEHQQGIVEILDKEEGIKLQRQVGIARQITFINCEW